VSSDLVTKSGVDAFVSSIADQGIPIAHRGNLIVYRIVPFTGAAAMREVETGVEIGDVAGWPLTPPHWIHVPNGFQFPGGSQQPSVQDGWSRYSRPHPNRLDSSPVPGREWIAHVRAFLGTAT
jgi:hypothetical protein